MNKKNYTAPMKQHVTAPKDKVPFFEKLMYGMGSGSFQISNDSVNGLANPVFNITLGLNLAWVGLVMTIARLFDAFTDPIMGKISDDFRSRWGRRRPFIFVGCFLTAFAFILIWMVPESWKGATGPLFTYFLVAMLFFYLCATIQCVPYHTLGLEMTADYHERTSVAGFKMVFSYTLTLFLPWVFYFAQSEKFGGNTMAGIRYWSFIIAGVIIASGILPAIFVKERYYKVACTQVKISMKDSVKFTFQNRPFLILTGMLLVGMIGGGMIGAFGPYLVYFYMFDGDTKAGQALVAQAANIAAITALISTPLVVWFSKRVGKLHLLGGLMIFGYVVAILKFFCYNKEYPYLIFVVSVLSAPVGAAYWTIINSMKADICDDDELRHGLRREGMFGSIGNWILKAASSSTHLLSGVILISSGFQLELKGDQDPKTFLLMRILFCAVPLVSGAIALFLLWHYPLNSKRMEQIRAELEVRRSTVT